MNRRVRRLVYLIVILVWLVFISFPFFAFTLAARGQIEIGSDPQNHLRIFLLQDPDSEGIGVEWARPLRQAPGCARTSVSYLMWEGEGESVTYCQCAAGNAGYAEDVCPP